MAARTMQMRPLFLWLRGCQFSSCHNYPSVFAHTTCPSRMLQNHFIQWPNLPHDRLSLHPSYAHTHASNAFHPVVSFSVGWLLRALTHYHLCIRLGGACKLRRFGWLQWDDTSRDRLISATLPPSFPIFPNQGLVGCSSD